MTLPSDRPASDDNASAAEYVLGVLSAREREDFANRLAREPDLAAIVRYWDQHFVSLTVDIAPVAPPAGVASRLDARLFGSEAKRSVGVFSSVWNSLAFWRGLIVASLAMMALLGWALLRDGLPAAGSLVAEVSGEQSSIRYLAYYDAEHGELRLSQLAGLRIANRSFELWLIAGKEPPVSLGVLPEAQQTRLAVPAALRSKLAGGVLAVSDEPAGGSPTGSPTGSVLATGSLTAI